MIFNRQHNKNLHGSSGFTLTELVLYVFLLSIVMVAVIQVVLVVLEANVKSGTREEVLSDSLLAMEALRNEIRQAEWIYTPTSVFGSHPGQLSLVTTKLAPSGENTSFIDFFISDDERLCTRRDGGATQCLTSLAVRVTDLRFVRLATAVGPEAVETYLTVEARSSRAELLSTYSTQSSDVIRSYNQ